MAHREGGKPCPPFPRVIHKLTRLGCRPEAIIAQISENSPHIPGFVADREKASRNERHRVMLQAQPGGHMLRRIRGDECMEITPFLIPGAATMAVLGMVYLIFVFRPGRRTQ